MAEEVKNTATGGAATEGQKAAEANPTNNNPTSTETKPEEAKAPSVEEVLAKAAQAEADAKKWKNQFDKQSSEIAELKKTLRSVRTAEENKTAEEEEAKAIHDAEFARLQEFERKTLAKDRYLLQGMTAEMAAKAADAEVAGDYDSLSNLQKQYMETVIKAKENEWLGDRGRVNAGTGQYSNMTKEQIMAIKDTQERVRAIAENKNLFGF